MILYTNTMYVSTGKINAVLKPRRGGEDGGYSYIKLAPCSYTKLRILNTGNSLDIYHLNAYKFINLPPNMIKECS